MRGCGEALGGEEVLEPSTISMASEQLLATHLVRPLSFSHPGRPTAATPPPLQGQEERRHLSPSPIFNLPTSSHQSAIYHLMPSTIDHLHSVQTAPRHTLILAKKKSERRRISEEVGGVDLVRGYGEALGGGEVLEELFGRQVYGCLARPEACRCAGEGESVYERVCECA